MRLTGQGIALCFAAVAIGLVFAGALSAQGAGVSVTASPGANGNGWHNAPRPTIQVDHSNPAFECEPDFPFGGPEGITDVQGSCWDPADPPNTTETNTLTVRYDETPPTVDPNPANGSGPVHTEPFQVTLNWDDATSGHNCQQTVTYSGGQQDVTCTDLAGNSRTVPLSYPYDNSGPPSISIDSGPADGSVSADRSPTFTFSSSEAGVQFWCEIDTSTFSQCTSPHAVGPLADGSHTFRVFAVDQTNLQSPTATRSWQIFDVPQNQTLPTIVGFPEEGETLVADQGVWVGGSPPITFTTHWQSCDAGGGGCSDIPGETGNTYLVKAADVDRRLRVEVRATGPAITALGNPVFEDSAPTGVVVALDPARPQTTILVHPASPTNRQRATFTFESSRPGPNSRFECKLDGHAFAPCLSGQTYIGLAAGKHVFYVKAILNRTNDTLEDLSPAAWVWRIDLVRPPPPTNVFARGGDAKVFLFWSPPRVADFAGTKVVRRNVGSLAPPVVRQLMGSRFTDRRVRNGVLYRYWLRTRDLAGNLSVARSVYARPRDPLVSPRDGAIVTSNPLLDWVGRPHATYYNVQVHRVVANGPDVKVLTTWPVATRYQIPRRWFYRRWRSLFPGVYIWRVWPGFGSPENEQYGRMIGSSVFTKR